MSDGSKIEWTDATWNVVIGCTKVSPGCDHCYAIRTATRFQEHPNPKVSAAYAGTAAAGEWTGRVNLVGDRLGLPLSWKRPRRIFVNAQSDLFHNDVPDEFIAKVWAVMTRCPQHTFQVLTKRHGRMRSLLSSDEFIGLVDIELGGDGSADLFRRDVGWPLDNVWLGVSVEDQARADLRIPALLDTPAAVRWLSCEPLLGPVTFRWAKWVPMVNGNHMDGLRGIDWIVAGGESGPGSRPMHPEWARAIRDQCAAAEVPFLFKQWGVHITPDQAPEGFDLDYLDGHLTGYFRVGKRRAGRELDGRTWDEYPGGAA